MHHQKASNGCFNKQINPWILAPDITFALLSFISNKDHYLRLKNTNPLLNVITVEFIRRNNNKICYHFLLDIIY